MNKSEVIAKLMEEKKRMDDSSAEFYEDGYKALGHENKMRAWGIVMAIEIVERDLDDD